jgi:glycosyltransferase involved in cell wall biosynthesis
VTAVHQFVPALLPRDATGDHTRALRDALRAAGWESDIYVEAAHDELQDEATYFEEYPGRARPGDVLLYQLGTASPVAEFLLGRTEPLVLDYHNVTPASFYEAWEDHTTAKVTLAREQVAALAPRAVLGIADSAFNARELEALGCPATAVVPILVDLDHHLDATSGPVGDAIDDGGGDGGGIDQRERARLAARHGDATVLLFVGRISPNKCHEHLVEALWVYRRLYDPDARLHLVGPTVTPDYADAVFAFADELGLSDAVHHGEGLTTAELAAWYADADVFVCLSRHEGFCIPLLEAMRAGTPIVALDAGAVAETLGDAGILLSTARPATVAAAVDRVHRDRALAELLVESGHRRLRDFAAATTRQRFVEVLGRVADSERVVA